MENKFCGRVYLFYLQDLVKVRTMGRWFKFLGVFLVCLVLSKWVVESLDFDEFFGKNRTNVSFLESMSYLESVDGISAIAIPINALMVGLTLVHGAAAKDAGAKQLAHPAGGIGEVD